MPPNALEFLPGRGACCASNCPCPIFLASDINSIINVRGLYTATTSYSSSLQHTELCRTCPHPWITHSVKADTLADFHYEWIRGSCVDSLCGGFFNVSHSPILALALAHISFSLRTTGDTIPSVCVATVGINISASQNLGINLLGHLIIPPVHPIRLSPRT
jgi:hypothetical protein